MWRRLCCFSNFKSNKFESYQYGMRDALEHLSNNTVEEYLKNSNKNVGIQKSFTGYHRQSSLPSIEEIEKELE